MESQHGISFFIFSSHIFLIHVTHIYISVTSEEYASVFDLSSSIAVNFIGYSAYQIDEWREVFYISIRMINDTFYDWVKSEKLNLLYFDFKRFEIRLEIIRMKAMIDNLVDLLMFCETCY